MEPTDRNAAKPRLTRAQWKRRKRLRLARNWAVLILVCAAIVALMTKGILWLLPKVNAMLEGPQSFDAASYDGTGYSFDADDERFVLVNTNLPLPRNPLRPLPMPMKPAVSNWRPKQLQPTRKWLRLRPRTALHWC